MTRLFFCLKLSEAQQQQVLAYQQQALSLCPQAKAVASDNLHLTLFFLGEVDAQQQLRLIAAANTISSPAFALTLDHLACFAKPEILYVAPSQVPAPLTALQQQVAALCKAEGFNDIHDTYRPHITLARHAKCSPALHQSLAPVTLQINQYALYCSARQDDRLQYRPLHCFALR
ncbi:MULTISPECIES: RNA 2',3'-cyclic phosphodiesterase [unclassified Arsukibacterium]|uniref:RNA 2',3'-cyclic phosphodiesterase n=1 Tax=unclassified Arsukibacterium TaxID=2635278 RepID=UPI000C8C352B|nr:MULTISPECIES: RNA 2',3'-cyclic phosphodiesterase [unclassified Arsukibacterium]MAA93580.1 RNA 2',3'-cyclic phosphodiesterase [Rheinheimera sp.]|tara:strand:- start:5367 stop:5888 length:522 start_codon:yes stop_codon:yes gene_type:complete